MSDELLPYYQRELAFIRKLGGEFAEAHPKIAGRLRMGGGSLGRGGGRRGRSVGHSPEFYRRTP